MCSSDLSVRLADALQAAAAPQDRVQDVLLQVNVAGEEQKSGVAPAEVEALAAHVAGLSAVRVAGVMCMAPFTDDEAALRHAQPGDLVLIFADALARGWKQITQFKPDSMQPSLVSNKKQAPQTIAPDLIELADDIVAPPRQLLTTSREFPVFPVAATAKAHTGPDEGDKIVRDDRGVFLAREAND